MTGSAKSPTQAPGRPRGFDPDAAREAALQLFWRQGFEATSLDELTAVMGISRSSFYALFGSKHAALLAAVAHYNDVAFSKLAASATAGDRRDAIRHMLAQLAGEDGGSGGCFMVNCVTELAPHDPQVAQLVNVHIERVEALLASLIASDDAMSRARALMSLALGATLLRKAGRPPAEIDAMLNQAELLLPATF